MRPAAIAAKRTAGTVWIGTVSAGTATLGAPRWLAPSRLLRRRPTFVVELVLISSWIAMFALLDGEALARSGTSTGALWWCSASAMAGMTSAAGSSGRSTASAIVAGLPMWALMSSAMMLPAALPAVRHVAVNSLCWRRGRAIAEFLAVYLGIWVAYGALVLGALAPLEGSARGGLLLGSTLALATAWQLTPTKLRALRACHRSSPLPPRGWRASVAVARFGLRNGGACLGSCWAIMLVMAVADSTRSLWMLALTALVCSEKLANRPRRATRCAAALLGAGALGAGLLGAVA
jgi:predicted metal-binding membrane protein